jgi:hypothetical protein
MTQPDLLIVCAAALIAVFTLLGTLAGVIRLLTSIFPEPTDDDAALLAAVSAAASARHPGMRVTRIEEQR